ncbi:MAG: glucosyltransferase domain-containing protein [Lachnospiraceae bacterium]
MQNQDKMVTNKLYAKRSSFKLVYDDRYMILVIALWLLLLNSYRLFFNPIGIDTEQTLYAYGADMNWRIGCGRFMSVIISRICFPFSFNYQMAVVLLVINSLIAMIGYDYCLLYFGMKNKTSRLIFSMLFLSYPVWAEQWYFVDVAFIFALGLFLSVCAAFFITKWLLGQKSYLIGACVCNILAVGMYQTYFYLTIANTIAFLFLFFYEKRITIMDLVRMVGKFLIFAIVSFTGYELISKICIKLFYHPEIDYAGWSDASTYIDGQIGWKSKKFGECINQIITYIQDSISINDVFGTPLIIFSTIAVAGIIIWKAYKKKNPSDLLLLLFSIALLICPYLGCIVKGGGLSAREQVNLPFVLAFDTSFVIEKMLSKEKGMTIRHFRIATVMAVVVVCVVIGNFTKKQLNLNLTDYQRYSHDIRLSNNIMQKIEEADLNYRNKKIVFLGYRSWNKPEHMVQGQMIGGSFFTWDYGQKAGINYRVYGFMQTIGYSYKKPSIEEIQSANALVDQISIYPNDGCIYCLC